MQLCWLLKDIVVSLCISLEIYIYILQGSVYVGLGVVSYSSLGVLYMQCILNLLGFR